MKKSLVLAMAMALGVTASAYAANPFSDVPAGHWAYDSVAKLAAAGVVDGYADGAFDGDKLMTRYEMAQIVAKAMAKGADCDKLAAEFADELDNLGVRVAKLEKGADAVKISGFVRFRYQDHDDKDVKGDKADLRSRIFVTGQVNDDWSYTGMLQSDQNISNAAGDDTVSLKRAYVEGKIGGMNVLAGRWDEIPASGAILDAYLDGIKVSYGKDVKVWGLASKAHGDLNFNNGYNTQESNDRVYAAGVETTVGVVDVYANWFKAHNAGYYNAAGEGGSKEIYDLGLGMNVAKDLRLTYEYNWGDKKYNGQVSKDGFVARVDYKGAGEEVGSYGIHAQWFDQPVNAVLTPTTDANTFGGTEGGYEGWNIGVDYTLAKNIQLCVNYYDTEAKVGPKDDEVLFSELYFFF